MDTAVDAVAVTVVEDTAAAVSAVDSGCHVRIGVASTEDGKIRLIFYFNIVSSQLSAKLFFSSRTVIYVVVVEPLKNYT